MSYRHKVREAYDKLHACCPQCGGDSMETSTVGYLMDTIETAYDGNRASCPCGWRGIVHDLVPRAEEPVCPKQIDA